MEKVSVIISIIHRDITREQFEAIRIDISIV